MASRKVVGSGAVGPEAMVSTGSPTTSERRRLTTVAGWASLASQPPLKPERCLRTALISRMVAGDLITRASVTALLSSRETPSRGRGIRLEPPPEIRQRTRSPSSASLTRRRMRLVPSTPASSGMGWLAPWSLILRVLYRPRAPWGTFTRPSVTRSPRTPSRASAMGPPAFPPPTTRMRRTPPRSRERPPTSSRSPLNATWDSTAALGSAASSAASSPLSARPLALLSRGDPALRISPSLFAIPTKDTPPSGSPSPCLHNYLSTGDKGDPARGSPVPYLLGSSPRIIGRSSLNEPMV